MRLAVGLDQRHVDAVDRGAAHQPDGPTDPHDIASPRRLNPLPDLLHHRAAGERRVRADERLQVRFPSRSGRARLHPSGLRAGGARRARRRRRDHRLYRLRLHRGLAACRLAAADHDAALAAADRPPADRADGRRHHAGRRSLRQGREPPHPHRRGDRREPRRHPRDLLEVPEVRGRRRQRHHGQQCRLAEHAQLHRLPARRRPAFLGQPHAVVRLGEAAARAPAGAVVPRIQLHDPAGLRLRRAEQAHRLRPADGRLRPVGQHRQRHRSRPPHARTRSCSR